MGVLCLKLAAVLDASDISHPGFGSGCHILRGTLTSLRGQPGGERSGNHIILRRVRERRTRAVGTASTAALMREEGKAKSEERQWLFSVQHKDKPFLHQPSYIKVMQTVQQDSKCLFT